MWKWVQQLLSSQFLLSWILPLKARQTIHRLGLSDQFWIIPKLVNCNFTPTYSYSCRGLVYLMGYMLCGFMLAIVSAGTLPTIKGGGRGVLEAWLHSMRSVRKFFTPFKRQKRVVVRHVTRYFWWASFFLLLISFGLFFCAVTFDMIILKIPARTLIGGGFLVGTTAALLSGIDSTKQHHRRVNLIRSMS